MDFFESGGAIAPCPLLPTPMYLPNRVNNQSITSSYLTYSMNFVHAKTL